MQTTRRKLIRIPPPSEALAEFCGIFLGDGGFRNTWQISISFNIHGDRPYAEFIEQLVTSLFDLQATRRIRQQWGAGDLIISSRSLVEFLESEGWRCGPKRSDSVPIPAWIAGQAAYQAACLRGLMDTDGSVYQHCYRVNGKQYQYPKLSFTNTLPHLRAFVETSLQAMGIPAYTHTKSRQVFVHDSQAVVRYFEHVGTHNPRYAHRIKSYLRRGARGADWSALLMR